MTGGPPVPGNSPGEYDVTSLTKFGFNVSEDPSDMNVMNEMFKDVLDKEGIPILEVARKYWDEPNYAEEQRIKIAEARKRSGR